MDSQAILTGLAALITFAVGVVKILEYLGIKPQHIKNWVRGTKSEEDSMSEPSSATKKGTLGFAVFLFALSAGFVYEFYLISRRPIQTTSCGMTFVQQSFTPKNAPWNSGLRVTIIADRERGPVQLLVVCDGDIGAAPKEGRFTKGGPFQLEAQGLVQSHPDVWNVKWRSPVWAADDFVTFELLSDRPIHVKWIFPISYNPGS